MGPKARRESRREEEEKEEDNKKREAALEGGSHEQQEDAAKEARRTNSRRHQKEAREPTVHEQDEDEDGFVDEDEGDQHIPDGRRASATPGRPRAKASSSKPATVFIHSRPVGRRRESVRQQVFGGGAGGRSRSGSVSDPNHLAPPSPSYAGRRGRPILNASQQGSAVGSMHNSTTSRDVSPASRSRGLRFAEGTAKSSETAPGPSFYKRPATHNPDLAVTRTASVQSNTGAADDPGSREIPKGQQHYNRSGSGSGSGLQMYKSRSIQSGLSAGDRDESDGEGERKGGFLSRLKRRSAA